MSGVCVVSLLCVPGVCLMCVWCTSGVSGGCQVCVWCGMLRHAACRVPGAGCRVPGCLCVFKLNLLLGMGHICYIVPKYTDEPYHLINISERMHTAPVKISIIHWCGAILSLNGMATLNLYLLEMSM